MGCSLRNSQEQSTVYFTKINHDVDEFHSNIFIWCKLIFVLFLFYMALCSSEEQQGIN